MKKICKYCGTVYDGDPGGSCCPECAAEQRETTLRPRECRLCGATFSGGPRAWYCPSCGAERKREYDRQYKRTGSARKLGSTDLCTVCGKPYIVKSGRQKYCPACAPEAIRQIDNAQSRAWNAVNTTPADRKFVRNAASAPIPCSVCGKLFVPTAPSKTCSPECGQKLHSRKMSQWESDHRKERNAYRRKFNDRHIGDTDTCVDCGKTYIITNGRQKRCPDCSKYIRKEKKDD